MNQQMLGGTIPKVLATFYSDKKNGNFTLLGIGTFAPTEKNVPDSDWDSHDEQQFQELGFLHKHISLRQISLSFSKARSSDVRKLHKGQINEDAHVAQTRDNATTSLITT